MRLAYAALIWGVSQNIQASAQIRTLKWPYGRNVATSDMLAVLNERKGTCGTKHALLKSLATERALPIRLMLGIYEMNARNTPE